MDAASFSAGFGLGVLLVVIAVEVQDWWLTRKHRPK